MTMPAIDLLSQDPHTPGSHMYEVVNKHLRSSDLQSVRVAMAYASWGGLSLVADAIESFLDRNGQVSTIFGVANGVTTPDALCYSLYLKNKFKTYSEPLGLTWDYSDSAFHTKLLEFGYSDKKVVVIGSGNLTNGGLAANHELAFVATVPIVDELTDSVNRVWDQYEKLSEKVGSPLIQKLSSQKKLGNEGRGGRQGEKLGLKLKRAKKPLFAHILQGGSTTKVKRDTLTQTSELTEKPRRLYLEILGETGGGHQVQLPVETLATFFGVADGTTRNVSFRFSGDERVDVQLTHFENNTHRVRLLPIKSLPRPLVLVFERSDEDVYRVKVVPQSQFGATITRHCTEQTRRGSRRWGLT